MKTQDVKHNDQTDVKKSLPSDKEIVEVSLRIYPEVKEWLVNGRLIDANRMNRENFRLGARYILDADKVMKELKARGNVF